MRDTIEYPILAIPVKIEELKAGLRAYVDAEAAVNLLQECINNAPPSTSLPPEILSTIKAYLFTALRTMYLIVYTELYSYTVDGRGREERSLYHLAIKCSADFRQYARHIVQRFSEGVCTRCLSLNGVKTYTEWLDKHGWHESDRNDQSPPIIQCDYCLACSPEESEGNGKRMFEQVMRWTAEDIELTCDTPLQTHPEASRILGSNVMSGLLSAAGTAFTEGWTKHMCRGTLLTTQEQDILNHFGFHGWTGKDYEKLYGHPHTSAWLVFDCLPPALTSLAPGSKLHLSQGPSLSSTAEQRLATQRVLRAFQLQPCRQLDRNDCSASSPAVTRLSWPQAATLVVELPDLLDKNRAAPGEVQSDPYPLGFTFRRYRVPRTYMWPPLRPVEQDEE